MKLSTLICLFLLAYVLIKLKNVFASTENNDIDNISDHIRANVTIHFNDIGIKILCDADEWTPQFIAIKYKLAKCLHLANIDYDERHETDIERWQRYKTLSFSDLYTNSYCRLARFWSDCYHYLETIECFEPDAEPLKRQSDFDIARLIRKTVKIRDRKIPSHDWRYLEREYRVLCLISAKQIEFSIFRAEESGFLF